MVEVRDRVEDPDGRAGGARVKQEVNMPEDMPFGGIEWPGAVQEVFDVTGGGSVNIVSAGGESHASNIG